MYNNQNSKTNKAKNKAKLCKRALAPFISSSKISIINSFSTSGKSVIIPSTFLSINPAISVLLLTVQTKISLLNSLWHLEINSSVTNGAGPLKLLGMNFKSSIYLSTVIVGV